MSSQVERALVGYRFVETQYGDTLQKIAARELGDASRWPEIVAYNALVPPFITDDPLLETTGVVLTGNAVKIPAPVATVDADTNPDATFLADVQLTNGLVEADDSGDMMLCQGLPNLRQAISHRIRTERSELIYHQEYGSLHKRLIGTVNGPTANLLAAQYISAAVRSDPRIQSVTSMKATVAGDAITVVGEVVAISGRSIAFNEGS